MDKEPNNNLTDIDEGDEVDLEETYSDLSSGDQFLENDNFQNEESSMQDAQEAQFPTDYTTSGERKSNVPRKSRRSQYLGEYRGEGDLYYPQEEDTLSRSDYGSSKLSTQERDEESTPSSETLSNVYSKVCPFNAQWAFGVKKMELINLSTNNEFEIFYVCSHFGIIYNYCRNKMTFLPGHNHPITSISSDATGRWLVSADAGEDTVIIIWDHKKKIPVWSLYNVFPNAGVKCVKISQDARFLAALSADSNEKLKFWLWTHGKEEPDGEIAIDPIYGKAKHVDFNHLRTEQFAVTMQSIVIFCQWMPRTKILKHYIPEVEEKKRILRESLFLDDNHTVVSSTSSGHVVVWCDIKFSDTITENVPGTIKKNFVKAVRIHKTGITSFRICDKVLASTSEDGTILFHDQELRLIYFIPKFKLDPLVCMSFHTTPYSDDQIDPFSHEFHEMAKQVSDEEIQNVIEYETEVASDKVLEELEDKLLNKGEVCSIFFSETPQKKKSISIPTDCTYDMRPFLVRDFMILTTTGKIGYVSHRRQKIKYYLYNEDSAIVCVDCNPGKQHVVVGNSSGSLNLYDYVKKKLLGTNNLSVVITTLKYSNMGHVLMAGTQSGLILEIDSLLLTELKRIDIAKSAIMKICFSPNDELLAFYDESSIVYLYQEKAVNIKQWVFMGRHLSHYKPIKDLMFEQRPLKGKNPRLFSIGEDRMLVEYDIKDLDEGKLKLLSINRIEQTAIPHCFTWHPKPQKSSEFLICNNEYKMKVVDIETLICKKTTLGPIGDTPINFMKVIPEKDPHVSVFKMLYSTAKHIGIRILPSTGNPFEGIGMLGHPEKLVTVAISHDYKYIFTAGVNDTCVIMWEINPNSVDIAVQLGGTGLNPFLALLEDGTSGFLFKEIEDFFYYAQIIHQGEDPNMGRSVAKTLSLCEIPDLFRALGYYPTEFEISNLLYELKHIHFEHTGELVTDISFEDCLKAFLNHRPVNGVSLDSINKVLLTIADLTDPSDIIVERQELYKALEEKAEAMEHTEAIGYLCILLLPKDENNPVPPTLTLKEFAEHVLGIDLTITEENVRQITHSFEKKTEQN